MLRFLWPVCRYVVDSTVSPSAPCSSTYSKSAPLRRPIDPFVVVVSRRFRFARISTRRIPTPCRHPRPLRFHPFTSARLPLPPRHVRRAQILDTHLELFRHDDDVEAQHDEWRHVDVMSRSQVSHRTRTNPGSIGNTIRVRLEGRIRMDGRCFQTLRPPLGWRYRTLWKGFDIFGWRGEDGGKRYPSEGERWP